MTIIKGATPADMEALQRSIERPLEELKYGFAKLKKALADAMRPHLVN